MNPVAGLVAVFALYVVGIVIIWWIDSDRRR